MYSWGIKGSSIDDVTVLEEGVKGGQKLYEHVRDIIYGRPLYKTLDLSSRFQALLILEPLEAHKNEYFLIL